MQEVLDTTGLQCPIPVLKARKKLEQMAPGDMLKVLATDPASPIDFRHFCNTSGHELIDYREVGGVHQYVIKRKGRD